ncbi:MAG: hypothetical protein WD534_13285 [Phycisphaeraceae bacterium]
MSLEDSGRHKGRKGHEEHKEGEGKLIMLFLLLRALRVLRVLCDERVSRLSSDAIRPILSIPLILLSGQTREQATSLNG